MQKAIKRTQPNTGGGSDSDHAGAGDESIVLGARGEALDSRGISIGADVYNDSDNSVGIGYSALVYGAAGGIAIGRSAQAKADSACGVGDSTRAWHFRGTAIGAGAETTADDQLMLGTSGDTVVVPGTFSNPSARHLKQNITPAPGLSSIFPELVEYEYIDAAGRRRLGYIADDLVGTDAERFVTFDNDGAPNGIDYLGLLVAQVAVLRAEITALKNDGGTHG